MAARSEDDTDRRIVRDLVDGIDETGIPRRDHRRGRLLLAPPSRRAQGRSARPPAHRRRPAPPISIHPGRDRSAPFEILEILVEAGADSARVVMGHIERTELDRATLLRLAGTGCYVESTGSAKCCRCTRPAPSTSRATPSGSTRSGPHRARATRPGPRLARRLPEDAPARYGAGGYAHIPANVVVWMAAKGMSAAEIDRSSSRTRPRCCSSDGDDPTRRPPSTSAAAQASPTSDPTRASPSSGRSPAATARAI